MPRYNPDIVTVSLYLHIEADADILLDIDRWAQRDEANSNIRRLIRLGRAVEQGYQPQRQAITSTAERPASTKPFRPQQVARPKRVEVEEDNEIALAKNKAYESIGGFGQHAGG